MKHSTNRRVSTLRGLAGLAAVALLATACGSDDEAATTTAAAETTAVTTAETTPDTTAPTTDATTAETTAETTADTEPAGGGTFPVSLDSQFGTAEIEARPERVVALGNTDGDYVLALGVTPVAMTDWYGDQPGGLWPWAAETDAAAAGDIDVLSSAEIEFEKIAAAEPDVIIAIDSSLEQADYDKLSAIAPVVASTDDYIQFGTPWDVTQLTIGKALGLEDEAQVIVDDVTEQIATAASDNPEWAEQTANFGVFSADGTGYLYTDGDRRGRLLADLGFTIPAEVGELAGDLFFASLSAEQVTLADADVLLWNTFAAPDQAVVEALPLFQGLGVVSSGHAIYLDANVTGAMSFGTTLSIPYALAAVVPQIEALAGEATAEGAGAIVPGEDADVDAVVEAYSTVFDSATTYDEKAPFLPDAAALKATVEGYAAAGEAVGGIVLQPTAVTIDGDNAAVTYDVLFAGTPVYEDLNGSAVKVDGAWTITRDEFCGFMASARNPCA